MKKVVKGFASVILASMIFVVGCKPPSSASDPPTGGSKPGQNKITVTVKGDEHVDKIITTTLSVAKGSTWSAVKPRIKVTYKNGFVNADWKVNGDDLADDYQFEKDTTVNVLSKDTVTVFVKGDERIDLSSPLQKEYPYDSKWSDIIADIKGKIKPSADWKDDWTNGDYAVYEWRLGDESGEKIWDSDKFTDNTTVYAVSNYVNWDSLPLILRGFKGSKPRGKIIIPMSMYVSQIGESAFSGCSGLTSITLPKYLTSIKAWAFAGCSSLTSIEIPEMVTSIENSTFSGCSSLTSIEIPEKVTSIGKEAFKGCGGLTSITLPKDLTSIGWGAFNGCNGLTSIEIPEKVTSIGKEAFKGCSNLASIEIPEGVTSIEGSTFSGCKRLESITLPKKLTSIGENAFVVCSNLASIEIPEDVTSIGWEAFAGCSSLKSITIPAKVTLIGSSAFFNCNRLSSCSRLTSATFADPKGWAVYDKNTNRKYAGIDESDLNDKSKAAELLSYTYIDGYYWKKN